MANLYWSIGISHHPTHLHSIECPPYCAFCAAISTKSQFTFQVKEVPENIPQLECGEYFLLPPPMNDHPFIL